MSIGTHNAHHLALLGPHTRQHATGLLLAFPTLHITSSYRTPARNAAVGGVPNSFHTRRRAIDVVGPLTTLRAARDWARRQRVGPRCTGPEEVLLQYVGTRRQHLHLAW